MAVRAMSLERLESPRLPSGGLQLFLFAATMIQAALFLSDGFSRALEFESPLAAFQMPIVVRPEVTGAIEMLAGVLLLVPTVRFWGAALIILLVLAASSTHIMFAEWRSLGWPVFNLALAGFIAWKLRPAAFRPAEAKPSAVG